jgi:ketosteroid isomerase-like protein
MPNGVLMAPNRPAIEGREEIRAWFEKFQAALELKVEIFEQTQVDVVGEVALVRYFSAGTYLKKKSQEGVPYEQKYLDVLRWVDGRWLIAYHAAGSCTFTPGVWDEDWESES